MSADRVTRDDSIWDHLVEDTRLCDTRSRYLWTGPTPPFLTLPTELEIANPAAGYREIYVLAPDQPYRWEFDRIEPMPVNIEEPRR